jgi:hypothetical protein
MRAMRNAYRILVRKSEDRRPLEDLDVYEKTILECILRGIHLEGVDWMHLAQDRDQRWDVVNLVINPRFP